MSILPNVNIRTFVIFTGRSGQGWIDISGGSASGTSESQVGDVLLAVINVTASPPVFVTVGDADTVASGPAGTPVFGFSPASTGFTIYTPPGGGQAIRLTSIWQESSSDLSGNTYVGIIGVGEAIGA